MKPEKERLLSRSCILSMLGFSCVTQGGVNASAFAQILNLSESIAMQIDA